MSIRLNCYKRKVSHPLRDCSWRPKLTSVVIYSRICTTGDSALNLTKVQLLSVEFFLVLKFKNLAKPPSPVISSLERANQKSSAQFSALAFSQEILRQDPNCHISGWETDVRSCPNILTKSPWALTRASSSTYTAGLHAVTKYCTFRRLQPRTYIRKPHTAAVDRPTPALQWT